MDQSAPLLTVTNCEMQGEDCHCLTSPGLELSLELAPSSSCSLACPGEPGEKCGGEETVTLVTAQCQAGWTRFGEKCLKELVPPSAEVSLREAQQTCVNQGANLWLPSSLEEYQFVTKSFWTRTGCAAGDHCHLFLGIKHYEKDFGLLAADNSHHLGYKGLTRESQQLLGYPTEGFCCRFGGRQGEEYADRHYGQSGLPADRLLLSQRQGAQSLH